MVTYEITKKFDDGREVVYFKSAKFDEVMQMLWDKHKYETGCTLVIKIPNYVDK